MKMLKNKQGFWTAVATLLLSGTMFSSCLQEQAPGTYYTFSGQTVADFLVDDEDNRFSDFVAVLKNAELYGELRTYGEFTCFAPTNDAFEAYARQKGISLDSLLEGKSKQYRRLCDTIAWTHLIYKSFFMSDQTGGALDQMNLNDRYLTLTFDSADYGDGHFKLRRTINGNAHLISWDDTVQNGVVHVVDSVIFVSGDYLYDVLDNTPEAKIFFQAMKLVGLEDTLKLWNDESYTMSYDSAHVEMDGLSGGDSHYKVLYWEKRKRCWTFLVEPDQVLEEKYGITTLEQLVDTVVKVYDESYPECVGTYDVNDYEDPNHPLRKFVMYHILPFQIQDYDHFTYLTSIIKNRHKTNLIDPEDYYETFLKHSLIRFSRVMTNGADKAGVYINRRSLGATHDGELDRPYVRGIRIYSDEEMAQYQNSGCNGFFYFIDDLLLYSKFVREDVLMRRLRIDCCTLSPDFMTSGARQKPGNYQGMGFKNPMYFKSFATDYMMWVRCCDTNNWSYEADGLDFYGTFDIMLKLPPVPFDGTWEFRLSYRGDKTCGVVQNYVGDDPNNLTPCGIPTDLTVGADENYVIHWVSDDELKENGGEEAVVAHDKSMRNRGYMKGPDSHSNGTDVMRDISTMARRIVTTDYFYANKDYYLRMKLVTQGIKATMNFDYMEWCPKSIYSNDEDRH